MFGDMGGHAKAMAGRKTDRQELLRVLSWFLGPLVRHSGKAPFAKFQPSGFGEKEPTTAVPTRSLARRAERRGKPKHIRKTTSNFGDTVSLGLKHLPHQEVVRFGEYFPPQN